MALEQESWASPFGGENTSFRNGPHEWLIQQMPCLGDPDFPSTLTEAPHGTQRWSKSGMGRGVPGDFGSENWDQQRALAKFLGQQCPSLALTFQGGISEFLQND